MSITDKGGMKIWHRFDRKQQWQLWIVWFLGVSIFAYCFQLISEKTIWMFVWDAPNQVGDLAYRMIPPTWGYFEKILKPLWDTMNIATLGTVLAIFIAVPIAFLAASNTTPSVKFIRPLALLAIVSSRSINSIIWALLLVAIVGPGLFAGIIAIGLRSVGFIAKLLYEAIEEIDHNQVEAIEATGAGRLKVLIFGILPQILPAFAGISVYRWDINIRESTVLGLVGAGGIGLQLNASIMELAWSKVSLILIAIIITVIFSEWISAKVRHAII